MCIPVSIDSKLATPWVMRSVQTPAENMGLTGCWWLTSVFLTNQGQKSGGSWFEASPGKYFMRDYLEKHHHTKVLVRWLKM
jgi:hypothetical protein